MDKANYINIIIPHTQICSNNFTPYKLILIPYHLLKSPSIFSMLITSTNVLSKYETSDSL